jgi:transcriptional regulator with XRE-family HTH domain
VDELFRKNLARVVIEARGDSNQREFGEKLGISQSTVAGWEQGNNIPNLENLIKIARLRGQLPEELLAELFGRTCGEDIPLRERVQIMTRADLIDLLELIATQLKEENL